MTITQIVLNVRENHTCEQGPLCEQMDHYLYVEAGYAEDTISNYYGVYPDIPPYITECGHQTCLGIVYSYCPACWHESMNEMDGVLQEFGYYDNTGYQPADGTSS
jgi:hypothetical protein